MSDSCFERLVQFYFWDEVRGLAELTEIQASQKVNIFNDLCQKNRFV
jgi:hypothetical protein